MANNTEEKSLTIIKDKNIFTKVIDFFHKIFNRKKQTYQYTEDINSNSQINTKHNFMILDNMEMKFVVLQLM